MAATAGSEHCSPAYVWKVPSASAVASGTVCSFRPRCGRRVVISPHVDRRAARGRLDGAEVEGWFEPAAGEDGIPRWCGAPHVRNVEYRPGILLRAPMQARS